jgi:hypothetical protein
MVSVLCFYFDGSLSQVIAINGNSEIVGRVITIWEAIQKRSHEPIYKTHSKIDAKRLRATNFVTAKLEKR